MPPSDTWSLEPSVSTPQAAYIDRFSGFVGIIVVTNTQTDTHTDHATPSVAIGRFLRYAYDAA